MESILSKLDIYTKQWAATLTEDDIAKLLQVVYKLPGLLETLRTGTAATIGKTGEIKFADICKKLPSNYQIQDTSKCGKKGDFIITYSNAGIVKRCLIDIKNYSTTVPKKEIDKFYEDMTFGSYDSGLILSYNTKFVGIAEHIHVEELCLPIGKTSVMYLVSSDEELILQCIELIINKSIIQHSIDINSSRIESLIENVNCSLTNSADVRRMLSDLQTNISKNIQKCQETLISHEFYIKKAIKEMSACTINLQKADVDRNTEDSKKPIHKNDQPPPLPPFIPRKKSPKKCITPIILTAPVESSIILPVEKDIATQKILEKDYATQKILEKDYATQKILEKDYATQKILEKDRQVFMELVELPWNNIVYLSDDKLVCEVTSSNMILRVSALKTKTAIIMDFLKEVQIPEADLALLIHKVTNGDSFVCALNIHLLTFDKKYMNSY